MNKQNLNHSIRYYTDSLLTLIHAGEDFSDKINIVTIPANTNMFSVLQEFTIVDDDIDEDEQSFAVVAEIGPDVPDYVSCFQLGVGQTECFGRRGATEIRISDNDRKFS